MEFGSQASPALRLCFPGKWEASAGRREVLDRDRSVAAVCVVCFFSWCCVDRSLQRLLLKSLVGVIGLPIVIAVTVGVAALLASVGDQAAARVCGWIAVAAGAGWIVVVVATLVAASFAVLSLESYQRQIRRRQRRSERSRSRAP